MSLWPHVPPIYTVSSTLHIVNNTWFLCYSPLTELLFLICWHIYRLEAFPYLRHNLDHLWFLFSLPFLTALCPSFNLLSRLALHFPRECYLLFSDWLFHLIILHLIHLIWYDLINLIIQMYLTTVSFMNESLRVLTRKTQRPTDLTISQMDSFMCIFEYLLWLRSYNSV